MNAQIAENGPSAKNLETFVMPLSELLALEIHFDSEMKIWISEKRSGEFLAELKIVYWKWTRIQKTIWTDWICSCDIQLQQEGFKDAGG